MMNLRKPAILGKSSKPHSALMIAILLTSMSLASLPMAHALSSPNGSWLGTQTFADYFQDPCNSSSGAYLSSTYSTIPGDQSVQNGEFNAYPYCDQPPVEPPTYIDVQGGNGGYLSLVGSGVGAQNGATVTASSLDCGQEQAPIGGPNCFSFYIPSYGQSSTPVDISTDAFVVGGLQVHTDGACNILGYDCGDAYAQASFQLSVIIQAIGTVSTWTIPLVNGDPISCTTNTANSWTPCTITANYNNEYQTAPLTFNLPSGYRYTATLQGTMSVSDSLTRTENNLGGGGTADYACFDYNSNCTIGSTTTGCPGQIPTYNGKCQYIQWIWLKFTAHQPDFSVSTPSSMSVAAGSSTSATLNVNNILVFGNNAYSLATPITLSATSNDPNLHFSFSSNPVSPTAGGSTPTTLTVADTNGCEPAGNYVITLTGSVNDAGGQAGAATHAYSIPISVTQGCNFTVSANPSSLIVSGTSNQTTITLNSLGGFSGTVSLTSTTPSGITATLSPTSVSLSSGGTATSILTLSVPASVAVGSYTVTVTATGGGLIHSVNIPITVIPGFTMSASPNYFSYFCSYTNCPPPYVEDSTLTVTSIRGFSGTISLTYIPPSGGFGGTAVTGPSSITVTSGGTTTTTLQAYEGSKAGDFTWTIPGRAGSAVSATYITIHEYVCSRNPCPTIAPVGAQQSATMATSTISKAHS